MTHKAETILSTIKTNLTGLTTTRSRVKRDQIRNIKETPALSIEMGESEIVAELSNSLLDCWQTVNIEITVAQNSELSTTINKIKEEIIIKLNQDITQGLEFVTDTEELDPEEIEFSGEGETPQAYQVFPWRFRYYRNRSNPAL